MKMIRLRYLAKVNPSTPAFSRMNDENRLTFLPMESVWPGLRLDTSQHRRKREVAVGYTRFQDGDLLVPKITPTFEAGRAVLIEGLLGGVGAGTTELHVIRPGERVDPRFLFYVVNTRDFLKLGKSEMYGVAGQQRVPDEFLRDFLVPVPSMNEQRRISTFLDVEIARIERLIGARGRMVSLLELKKDRLAAEILGLEASGRKDLTPLKYIVSGVTVGIVITPAKWYTDSGGVPALRGLNVRPGSIDSGSLVRISARGHAENLKSRLAEGDVVVVRTGRAGAAAVVPAELAGANCIDLIILRPGERVAPRYLEYVLNSNHVRSRVVEHSVGSIQAHFNVSAMKRIAIPNLSQEEQCEVVERLDVKVESIETLRRKFVRQQALLTERRQALITAAVTGQFDVSTASGRNVTDVTDGVTRV
ncbi:restriction endonuclease subunit S [Streptomyces diastaticus]|uniref:restriction endonuclease subunit S n=1 Tax=Streptomyces diastaticus TaxID=1956 RepID=UPI00343CA64C